MMNKKKLFKMICFAASFLIYALLLIQAHTIQAQETNSPSSTKYYKLRNKHNNLYVHVPNHSTRPDVQIEFTQSEDSQSQIYKLHKAKADGYYTIKNMHSDLVFDVRKESRDKNIPIIQYRDKDSSNQQFALSSNEDGTYFIRAKHSGLYLSILHDSMEEGAQLVQYPLKNNGQNNNTQRFYLEEVSEFYVDSLSSAPNLDKVYMLRSRLNNLYVDIPHASLQPSTKTHFWSKNGHLGQLYRIEPAIEDDFFKIRNINSGLVLDVKGASKDKKAPIAQYYDKNTSHQQFAFEIQTDGTYRIKARHSGQYFTVLGDSMKKGAKLIQYPYNESTPDTQEFYLEEVTRFNTLDDYIEYKVKDRKIMEINNILQGAICLGFDTDENEVKDKIELIINQADAQEIFTNDTGFIITYGMLKKKIDDIALIQVHNAFANNKDNRSSAPWDTYKTGHTMGSENNDISIGKMLNLGYKVMDIDIGENGNGKTASYHRFRLAGYTNLGGKDGILKKMKDFLDKKPSEFLIIHISDVYNGNLNATQLNQYKKCTYKDFSSDFKKQFNHMLMYMKELDMLTQIYNFTGNDNTDSGQLFNELKVLGQDMSWPTVKDMLLSNKRILLIYKHAEIAQYIQFDKENNDPNDCNQDTLILTKEVLDTIRQESMNKFIAIALTDDWGASAASKDAARINNQGKRMYDMLHKIDTTLQENNIDRRLNVVSIDYATGNKRQGGWLEVSPVDAANRANFDRFGYEWSKSTVDGNYWDD